ncbi:TPA: hypothetical protein U5E25_001636 [Yersinia enterocolitica]|nr:hypothetical protein [Yersinia enterocolitica]
MFLGTMSSKDWIIVIESAPVIGLADSSNIELEMMSDKNSVTAGIGGDWSFVQNPDTGATLKFTTQRNSISNAYLHQLLRLDRIFTFTLTNKRNGSTHSAPYGMIQRQPTDGALDGKGAQTLDWAVITGDIKSVIV